MGATVNAHTRSTNLPFATTTTNPNGRWTLHLDDRGYRIEIINGSERVMITGDEVEVETVEMARAERLAERRADEKAGRQPPWWRRMCGLP